MAQLKLESGLTAREPTGLMMEGMTMKTAKAIYELRVKIANECTL
jgi:hypothetical protein